MMNLDDLYTFQVVAREKSFSKAAEKLHFVQSNITAKMKRLEAIYQTSLFYRHRHGVTLTPAGEILLDYTDKIIASVNDSKREIIYAETPTGPLKIGSMETTAAVRLPALLSTYHRLYPNVDLILNTGSTTELIEKVLTRQLDGAFIAGDVQQENLDFINVYQENMILIGSHSSVLEQINKQTMIVFKSGCFYRNHFEKWLHKNGFIPRNKMELNTLEGIIGCVKSGLGISLLTEAVITEADSNQQLARRPLEKPFDKVVTRFIFRKDCVRTKAFNTFLTLCRKE